MRPTFVIDSLLMSVVRGELDKVEDSLKANPQRVHAQGDIRDLAGRNFPRITVLQYALWSLDAPMWTVIMKYMDPWDIAQQIQDFEERKDITDKYGLQYDFEPLLQHYQILVDNYSVWSWPQINDYWVDKIGPEQANWPAWMIYLFTEPGDQAVWTTQDENCRYARIQGLEFNKWREYISEKHAWARGQACTPYTLACHYSWYPIDKSIYDTDARGDAIMFAKCVNAAIQLRQLLRETVISSLPRGEQNFAIRGPR